MNPSIPSWESIAMMMFSLAFLAYTVEQIGNMIFDALPWLNEWLARDGKYIKGASFKRLFLTLIAWQITSGFHLGVITKFTQPDFEIAKSATSLDYWITACIISGGSAMVYEYTKRMRALTVEIQSKAAIVESKAVVEEQKAAITESKAIVEENKAAISQIKLENAGG